MRDQLIFKGSDSSLPTNLDGLMKFVEQHSVRYDHLPESVLDGNLLRTGSATMNSDPEAETYWYMWKDVDKYWYEYEQTSKDYRRSIYLETHGKMENSFPIHNKVSPKNYENSSNLEPSLNIVKTWDPNQPITT